MVVSIKEMSEALFLNLKEMLNKKKKILIAGLGNPGKKYEGTVTTRDSPLLTCWLEAGHRGK